MLVKEILESKIENGINEVFTLNENDTAYEAVAKFDEVKIGSLIIIDDESQVKGIVTEKDILYKCYNSSTSLRDKKVKDLLTPIDKIIIGKEDDDCEYLRNVITNRRIRHIPIFNSKNKLIGIVSSGDIIKAEIESRETEIKLLKEHIQNPFGIHLYS